MLGKLIKLAEDGYLPDFLVRKGIRRLCKARLDWKNKVGPEMVESHHQEWVEKLKKSEGFEGWVDLPQPPLRIVNYATEVPHMSFQYR